MCACVSERAASRFDDRCFPVSLSSPLALFVSLSLPLPPDCSSRGQRAEDRLAAWLAGWLILAGRRI